MERRLACNDKIEENDRRADQPFVMKGLSYMGTGPGDVGVFIGPDNAAVARYDGTLADIPNTHALLNPLNSRKAALYSHTDGTQGATLA